MPRTTAPSFKVGDLVWASPDWDDAVKEPASVLKMGCQYTNDDDKECDDGVMVKFQVSVKRMILPLGAVTVYREEEATTGRRSARVSRAAAATPKVSRGKVEGLNRRAMVTPSPTSNHDLDGEEEDPMDIEEEKTEEEQEVGDQSAKERGRSDETSAKKKGRVSSKGRKNGMAKMAYPEPNEDEDASQGEDDSSEKEEEVKPADKKRGRSATKKNSPKISAAPNKEACEVIDVDEEEDTTKKRGRSATKKAPTTKKTAMGKEIAGTNKDEMDSTDGEVVVVKVETKKRGRSSSTSTPKKTPTRKTKSQDEDDKKEEEAGCGSPYFNKKAKKAKSEETKTDVAKKSAEKASAKKKPAANPKKQAATTKKPAATKKKAPAKKKKSPNLIVLAEEDAEEEEVYSSGAENVVEDSEDDEDKPFQVEYASSNRSTCRRCDQIIQKGTIRISHVPLFRGKPGFRVYRHLECIVFSEQVQCAQDVGGWRHIKKTSREDFERLALRVEESKIELEKENEELQPDELVQVTFQGEMRKPPPGLTATLLPFQVEGVSWMYHQETQLPDMHGGILADEMGMGKTLQTLTTMLDNRAMLQHSKPGAKHPPSVKGEDLEARKRESDLWDSAAGDWKHEMEMNNVPKKMWPKKQYQAARAGTLVVCPVIALTQWKAELEKFTAPGTFTIATYHGPNRQKEYPLQKLVKYDIVLTTYQCIEQDFRKMTSPNKVACPNCGGKFKIDKLRVHLKYFCGEGAERTEAQARQQRTADRPNRGGDGGGGNSGGRGVGKGSPKKKSFTDKKKPPMTTTKSAKAKQTPTKKAPAKKRGGKRADRSESEVEEVETTPTGRPSRSAAVAASRRVSSSMSEWSGGAKGGNSDDDSFRSNGNESEDDDEESVMSYDEEDSEGEAISPKQRPKKKSPPKKAMKPIDSDSNDSDSESSDEEEVSPALARIRKRQQQALEGAKKGKGKKLFKSKGKRKGTAQGKAKAKGKGKGKKKFDDDDYPSSDESGEDTGPKRDVLEGIDLEALMKEAMEGSHMSLLHSVCWWRIVLDEAHMIKSRNTNTASATFALVGVNRWALSGTPLQNRVGELYSLIRFIRINPMAHYFCRSKGCGCKSLHYRIKNGVCQDCGHRGFQHYSHFNKHVLNPIQRDGYSGDGRRAMFILKNEVLDKCLLRRTKETRAEDMNLPPRIVTIRTINLHPVEKDFYDALYTQTKSSFSDYVAQGTLLNNYAHIFDLLTRMRQAVNHPYLIVYSKRNCDAAANSAGSAQIANGSTDCDICHEPPQSRVVSSCCRAAFCRSCVMEYMTPTLEGAGEGSTPCPSCQAPFSIDLNQASSEVADEGLAEDPKNSSPKFKDNANGELGPSLTGLKHVTTGSILRRINLAEFATSTKIEALVQELVEMRKARPGSKALVFSQFVNMLDLIRWRLHSDPCLAEMGLGARIIHGAMNRKSRDAALDDFREDGNVRVLLMSLKAGGVALNLTVASEVFLVDNWWNPAAEMQAIDRTHRLGQHRAIRAVRFIAEGTVEERVLQLQEKKRLVFDGTVGRDAGSLKMLTVDDMHSLFQ